ncbi:MAG: Elongation factor G-like protein [Chromatiales bacterium USCg_Taylor]|nr:MAG: Elongation factor G-like protein [Chromatiales bacterium USCg_Taylor]
MAGYTTQDIRNIALAGHAGAGKTTLVEAILERVGAIKTVGTVERGNTVSDHDPLEKAHQHSLNSTVLGFDYQGKHLNLIDTPGYPDFIGRALSVLAAVETAAIVVNAQTGVQTVTQRMMAWARARELDRLIVINQIDAENVDLLGCLEQIRRVFGDECLPINLPADNGRSVVDCFFEPTGETTDFSSVAEAHTKLIDQVVEVDDALMELYLEQGQSLDPEQLHDPFEKALREGHLIPVCFVSARTGAGLAELLEILVKLMPNPLEGNPPAFLKGEGASAERVEITPDPARHALAHVFKVAIDAFVGRLGMFRIHQGTITKDSQLFIGDGRKPFKVGHLFKLLGKESSEIPAGIPGDICAVAKADEIHFDAVLHDSHEEDHIHLKSVSFPLPMHGLAIAAKSRGDEQRLSDTLHKLEAEDPSARVEHNTALNETVLRGLGDLHVRVLLETMKERFHVEVETRPPKIAYRETVTAPSEGHHRHKKQTGGAGQFGEVFLRVRPLERGEGYKFVDAVVGGVIPRQFIPAVEKGILQAIQEGVVAGYQIQDLEVTLYDGKYHPVDSKEVAFVAAGKKAFSEAFKNAKPVVLEPIVDIRITLPSANMGDITGDLSTKRGRVSNTSALPGGMIEIAGQAPLSELEQYQSQLKSMTGGHGSYTIELSHYDPVPVRTQQQLMAAFKPQAAED